VRSAAIERDEAGARAERLISDARGALAQACSRCQAALCPHGALISIAMGFKVHPVCPQCLRSAMDLGVLEFDSRLRRHFQRLACYRAGWRWAADCDGAGCAWAARLGELEEDADEPPQAALDASGVGGQGAPAHAAQDASFDAGEMACGELVLELRLRLLALPAGAVLKLTAQDPGAPQDIPAWCAMVGHTLLSGTHPTYWIRRRG
jgi:tRNA 2-thiouridine synthesizing protein A